MHLLMGMLVSQNSGLGFALSATSAFYVVGGLLLLVDCMFFFRSASAGFGSDRRRGEP